MATINKMLLHNKLTDLENRISIALKDGDMGNLKKESEIIDDVDKMFDEFTENIEKKYELNDLDYTVLESHRMTAILAVKQYYKQRKIDRQMKRNEKEIRKIRKIFNL